MGINREKAHLLILPEDDKNRQMAVGFEIQFSISINTTQVRTLPECKGWPDVCETFNREHARRMKLYNDSFMVLLVDFDEKDYRKQQVLERIPEDVKDRIFVVGVWSSPEKLSAATSLSPERMGKKLAEDCPGGISNFWKHDLLKHNQVDVDRLCEIVVPRLQQLV